MARLSHSWMKWAALFEVSEKITWNELSRDSNNEKEDQRGRTPLLAKIPTGNPWSLAHPVTMVVANSGFHS